MISKIVFLLVLAAAVIYTIIPSEWKQIYICYKLSPLKKQIIIPVPGLTKEQIEDTYGADRSDERKHEGLDLFSARGTEVFSCCNGEVLYTGRDVYGGNTIRILGEDNRIYYYAHLDRYADIEQDQKVLQGQVIGYVGNTGNALTTVPHLHFEIMEIKWLFPMIKKNINPYNLLKQN